MTKLRFAVVGCGRMGKRRAHAILKNPNSELAFVVDNDRENAEILAKEVGCDFFTDYREVDATKYVDAVVVSMPNRSHAIISIDNMKLGRHVFCEKPLTITNKEARLMVETALNNKVFLKAGSNVRFFENILKAKELIDRKTIGKLLFSRGWIGHEGWNLKPDSWFTDPAIIGGGTLLDNGCHIIDIIRWFMGEIKECFGHRTTLFHKLPNTLEDNFVGVLMGSNNEPATIQSSWTEWDGYLYLEFHGEDGAFYIDSRGNEAKTVVKMKNGDTEIFDYSKEPKTSFQKEIDDFVLSILNGRQPLPSGYDGMRVIQIINGLYESAKRGRKMTVYGPEEDALKKMLEKTYGQSF